MAAAAETSKASAAKAPAAVDHVAAIASAPAVAAMLSQSRGLLGKGGSRVATVAAVAAAIAAAVAVAAAIIAAAAVAAAIAVAAVAIAAAAVAVAVKLERKASGRSERQTARYMGVCVLQAPGGWTRVGPTWILPAGCGWAIYGPGVARWGTSAGLAQLASESSPTPSLHAVGLSVCPDPNIVYALTEGARPNKELAPVFEIEEALRGSPYVAGGVA